jgi:hypothetical protein
LALLLAAAPLGALQAQSMPVPQFLAKAEALKKKGPLALLSRDLGLLKKEVMQSAKLLRAERLAAKAAGRKPAYCPPEGSGSAFGSEELLAHFKSIPPAQAARMRVKDGMRTLLAGRFPCPA